MSMGRTPDDSRKYDSYNCVNYLSNCANDLMLKLNCPSKANLNPMYKIRLQTPDLVSKQSVIERSFSHNIHKAPLSTDMKFHSKLLWGELWLSPTDSDRHNQLGTQLSIWQ